MAGDVPALALAELRRVVMDPVELDKGVRVLDQGGLAHLSRHGARLYAEADGAGPAPYRVSVAFDARGEARARCTCMAARSRPFCKHAAGLLVAWAQAPASFAVAEGPPPGQPEERRRRAIKTGRTDAAELMRTGVAQVETLVRELAGSGLASITSPRLDEIRTLGGTLRERRLRRLAGRTLALADLLEPAARREAIDAGAAADVIADLLLTARRIERHVGGDPLEPRHVEELVGKTWRKADREPVAGLDLVEVAFSVHRTPDDFVVRESRLVDLGGGEHWTEKQILPAFLARRTPTKPSRTGLVLVGASGSAFPGFPPRRLDLESFTPRALDAAALARLVGGAFADVGAALAAFQAHRRDLFAPERMPVAVRVSAVLVAGGRARAIDAGERAMFLPGDDVDEALAAALRDGRLAALVGDVGLDGALPTLWPVAAVIDVAGVGLELRPLPRSARAPASSWLESARASGASPAAISLAEVRGELAELLIGGLGSLAPRVIDPVAARLGELGLERPAALLAAMPGKPDPDARTTDFVKLHQVLGVALVRLGGAVPVDRSQIEPVPGVESVAVVRRDEVLPPREVARRVAAGELGRWDAAAMNARWFAALSVEELLGEKLVGDDGGAAGPGGAIDVVDEIWAHGAAAPHVARALAGQGERAIAAAERALAPGRGRTARMTALRVLAGAAGPRAEGLLDRETRAEDPTGVPPDAAESGFRQAVRWGDPTGVPPAAAESGFRQAVRWGDPGLRSLAVDLLEATLVARGDLPREAARERRARLIQAAAPLVHALAGAPRADQRELAVAGLSRAGARHAIPALRQARAGDESAPVREAATLALAVLGDAELVDGLVAALGRRGDRERDREARVAARALGILGDARGRDELLAAFGEGWQPAAIAEALGAFGTGALGPALDLLEARPELARRRAASGLVEALPSDAIVGAMVERLDRAASAGDVGALTVRARLYLKLVGGEDGEARRQLAAEVLARVPAGAPGAAAVHRLASAALSS